MLLYSQYTLTNGPSKLPTHKKKMTNEKRVAIVHDKTHTFEKIWYPWIESYLPLDFDKSL